ncbi:MAG: ATP-dependent zinc metalloprotease FtsH [Planctomycetota bacterium]|jgi:cell division protease FtsH
MNDGRNKKPFQFKPEQNGGKGKKPPLPSYRSNPMVLLLIMGGVFLILATMSKFSAPTKKRWDEFVQLVEDKKIEKIEIKDIEIKGKLKDGTDFVVNINPELHKDWLNELQKEMRENGVEIESSPPPMWLYNLIYTLLPLFILIIIFYFLFARNLRGGAGGMLMSFGRSKHRLHGKDKAKVTFKDVAGIEEAKDEVAEIIEFLKNPKKFNRLGGRIPRGVLLIGPPGCGKTLLAKAIAGQADVPFFSISGSDFVEMFVGVGASRVRDLFKQAKDNSPCIIFLDEIDAIGRKRSAAFVGGGHDEREQTLNAILVEMDGFETNDQVIVIAATNRADILDHALTRPGRFDRQVVVPLPDLKGRLEILKVHAKTIKLSPDANLERVARGTPMFSGADLAAIINEAALAATMANKDNVETADLEEARDKVRWGRAKKSRVVDDQDRKITAYHEAGHAYIQSVVKDADPLHKVSIIPRGPFGGATFALPEKDRTHYTKRYCMAFLQICFGGRIAEELFCDDISSGAQADIKQATEMARQMILTWGMSDKLGPISYDADGVLGGKIYGFPSEKDYSDETAQDIDKEIKRLIDEAYQLSKQLIETNKDKLEKIAQALLKYETLDADDVKVILEGGEISKPTVADLLAMEQAKTEQTNSEQEQDQDKGTPEQNISENET